MGPKSDDSMTARSRRVYIAGPYTFAARGVLASYPQRKRNIQRAAEVAERFRRAGWIPFLPHSMYDGWSSVLGGSIFSGEEGHGEVMRQCLQWVERCDALVRIPGYSPVSDQEAAHAKSIGLEVYSLDEIDKLLREPLSAQE